MSEANSEPLSLMEPLRLSANTIADYGLDDLAVRLTRLSTRLNTQLPPSMTNAIANAVRSMNCYYSNLIEGHDTHPIDIEKALNNDYSRDPKKRDLQQEAKAHIETQQWLDEGGLPERGQLTKRNKSYAKLQH